jgi:hypothetical protein
MGSQNAASYDLPAAIGASDDAVSIEATYAMRASFAASGFAPAEIAHQLPVADADWAAA